MKVFSKTRRDFLTPLASSYLALWVIAVVAFTTYSNSDFVPSISAVVADSWCEVGRESIGVHCFSDYSITDEIYFTPFSFSQPITWFLVLFHWLGMYLGQRLALILYLVTLFTSILAPFVSIARRKNQDYWWLFPIFVLSAPVLVTLDRANSIGLAVAPLFYFLRSLHEKNFLFANSLLVLLVAIRPQLMILVLLMFVLKQWKSAVLVMFTSVAVYFSSILLEPGSFGESMERFMSRLSGFSGYQDLTNPHPINISLSRSAVTLMDLFGLIERGSRVPNLLLQLERPLFVSTVCILLLLVWRALGKRIDIGRFALLLIFVPMLFPSTVFFYYTILLYPVLAFCFEQRLAGGSESNQDRVGRWDGETNWLFAVFQILFLLIVLYPLPLTTDLLWPTLETWKLDGQPVFIPQLLVGPVLAASFATLVVVGLFRADVLLSERNRNGEVT